MLTNVVGESTPLSTVSLISYMIDGSFGEIKLILDATSSMLLQDHGKSTNWCHFLNSWAKSINKGSTLLLANRKRHLVIKYIGSSLTNPLNKFIPSWFSNKSMSFLAARRAIEIRGGCYWWDPWLEKPNWRGKWWAGELVREWEGVYEVCEREKGVSSAFR